MAFEVLTCLKAALRENDEPGQAAQRRHSARTPGGGDSISAPKAELGRFLLLTPETQEQFTPLPVPRPGGQTLVANDTIYNVE